MFFNHFKHRWMRKELNRSTNRLGSKLSRAPRTLLIVFDIQEVTDYDFFYQWAQQLGIDRDAVTLLAYTSNSKQIELDDLCVIDNRVVGFMGGITDIKLKQLMQQAYDLQINYYSTNDRILNFVSQSMQSSVKIGLGNDRLVDSQLVIQTSIDDSQVFITELKKYIKILIQ